MTSLRFRVKVPFCEWSELERMFRLCRFRSVPLTRSERTEMIQLFLSTVRTETVVAIRGDTHVTEVDDRY